MTGATVPRLVDFHTSLKRGNAQVDVTTLETTQNLPFISCVQSPIVVTMGSIITEIYIFGQTKFFIFNNSILLEKTVSVNPLLCSQTCVNDHLRTTTTTLRTAQANLVLKPPLNNDHMSTATSDHLNVFQNFMKTCLEWPYLFMFDIFFS